MSATTTDAPSLPGRLAIAHPYRGSRLPATTTTLLPWILRVASCIAIGSPVAEAKGDAPDEVRPATQVIRRLRVVMVDLDDRQVQPAGQYLGAEFVHLVAELDYQFTAGHEPA